MEQKTPSPRWQEEQLRYRVLECIYGYTGDDCERSVTGLELQSSLNLPHEQLYRSIVYLSDNDYVAYLGAGPRVCITSKGVTYVAEQAYRRRSVRD